MLITRNLAAYAKACNLYPQSLLNHMQNDSFARQQFDGWLEVNYVDPRSIPEFDEARQIAWGD